MKPMQWSKLRTKVESLFAEGIKGRVGLYSTRYRSMHDHEGRSWITLDGEEIVNMPHVFKWLHERDLRAAELLGIKHDWRWWKEIAAHHDEAERQLAEESFFCQSDLGDAMFYCINHPIDDILSSDKVLVRALGMLDRRLG